jgi:hypothetical protein
MLLKAKESCGVTIYRRGIGYVYKLLTLANSTGDVEMISHNAALFALRHFTDIKIRRVWLAVHRKKAVRLINDIIRFNLPPSNSEGGGGKKIDMERMVTLACARISYYTGWTIGHILDEVDLITYTDLMAEYEKIYGLDKRLACIGQHSPKALFESLDKAQGVQKIDLNERVQQAINRKARQNGGQGV